MKLAASEAKSVHGKLKTQNKSKSHQLGRPKSLCAAIQRPSKPTPTIRYAQSCVLCESVHELRKCPVFFRQSPQDRKRVVQENKLCYNCLRRDHRVFDCKSKECGRHHHTLLHIKQVASEVSNRPESEFGSTQGKTAEDCTTVVSTSTSLKKSIKKRDSVKQTVFKKCSGKGLAQ